MIFFCYMLTGALAGVIAGLLGLGGGVIIVPLLYLLFDQLDLAPGYTMQLAIGSSLATIIFTSISSSLSHYRLGNLLIKVALTLSPGIILGSLIGVALAETLSTNSLKRIFGLFEIIIALQIGFGLKPAAHRTLPRPIHLAGCGVVIGSISTLMGIGGGSLSVPFLLWNNVPMAKAIGTAAICGLPIAIGGTLGFIIAGLDNPQLPEWSLGYVYLPAALGIITTSIFFAPLGARLASRLPVATLRRIFALFLGFIGINMLIG